MFLNICSSVEISVKNLGNQHYGIPGRIETFLGADIYRDIMVADCKKGTPCAVKKSLTGFSSAQTAPKKIKKEYFY